MIFVIFSPQLLPDCYSTGLVTSSALLFAMGLQNALVIRVSQSVVRTTHLTRFFIELGIELSVLFFHEYKGKRLEINKSIFLRLMIIICFFSGEILGAPTFEYFQLKTLLIPAVLLLSALWYDGLLLENALSNIAKIYADGNMSIKRKIIRSIFPEKLEFIENHYQNTGSNIHCLED